MKTLIASAILAVICAIPAIAQEGRWQSDLRTMNLQSDGGFTERIDIDPNSGLFEELAVLTDSANFEPIKEVFYDIRGKWRAEGDSLYIDVKMANTHRSRIIPGCNLGAGPSFGARSCIQRKPVR